MICFTALFKIITAVATCSYWLPILVYAFVLSSGKERVFQWGQIQPPSPPKCRLHFLDLCILCCLSIIAKSKNKVLSNIKFCSSTCMDTPSINFFNVHVNSILSQSWPDHFAKRFMSTVCLILDHVSVSCRIVFPDPDPAKFP